MTALALLASEHEAPPPDDVFTVVGAILLLLLMLVYVAGLPATLAVAAVFWRQRTRANPPPLNPSATVSAPAGVAPAPHPAGSPPSLAAATSGEALLHLQAVERQVLALRESPPGADVCARLAVTITDLIARHGPHSTAGRYASGLQAIVAGLAPLHTTDVMPADPPEPPAVATGSFPELLRVGLARLAAEGRPVPERWAFAWYGHLAERWPPGADGRRVEIAHAFAQRYRDTYPHGGMIVPLTHRTVVVAYTPASARFGGRPLEIATNLPDVAASPDATRRLSAVGATAMSDLQPPVTS